MPKIGLDFARVLRTALRQDPDIILVGEMRDPRDRRDRPARRHHRPSGVLHAAHHERHRDRQPAARHGRRRLHDRGRTAWHRRPAAGAARVRPICAQPAVPDRISWPGCGLPAGAARLPTMRFVAGAGCTYCNLTGYRGRVAVYEILEIDRTLADAIRRSDLVGFASAARLRRGLCAADPGRLELAGQGVTCLAEAISVAAGWTSSSSGTRCGEPRAAERPLAAARRRAQSSIA